MRLDTPVEQLRSVGPRNKTRLAALGIKTLKDLLWHFPSRYEDYTETTNIADIEPGQKASIRGTILRVDTRRLFPPRRSVTTAVVSDDSGAIGVVWFNRPFIADTLPRGTLVSLAGKATLGKNGLVLSNPEYEKISSAPDDIAQLAPDVRQAELKHTSGLVPVYPETEGITSKYLRFLVNPLLGQLALPDPVPKRVLARYDFPSLTDAVRAIHFPDSKSAAGAARDRLAFDDLLLFQLKALIERRKLNQLRSSRIPFSQESADAFLASLSFTLTKDQKVAAWEIIKDLGRTYPMNRLLEGDVGSGKTVVALMAALQAAHAGHQTVFMAPTEVLATQHYHTISQFVPTDVSVALLTASTSILNGVKKKKSELKKEVAAGAVHIIIGTHAVIQKDVTFANLALVVIDEQHRFGVQQRAALLKSEIRSSKFEINSKSEIQNPRPYTPNPTHSQKVPHLLSMTATPIPRTLALTIYGDLDISLIKEKPQNRRNIITKIVLSKERAAAYESVHKEVRDGRQIFVICPRIEASDPKAEIKTSAKQSKMNMLWAEVKAVEEEHKKLSEEIFPDLHIAMLHGKMTAKQKNAVMADFKDKKYDILVSTSVIEVGVDVPNASVMMIESAERFGLTQLHQFRGRVGRAEHQSYCLLFSSSGDRSVNQRLRVMATCDDGFMLAEEDMKLRGPGQFFGTSQSGLPDLAMASLANVDLIKKARLEARLLLKEDPSLKKYPLLKDKLSQFQRMTHFE